MYLNFGKIIENAGGVFYLIERYQVKSRNGQEMMNFDKFNYEEKRFDGKRMSGCSPGYQIECDF